MTTLMYHDRKMMVVLTRKCECFIIELDVLGTWGRENYGKPLFLSIQYNDGCMYSLQKTGKRHLDRTSTGREDCELID